MLALDDETVCSLALNGPTVQRYLLFNQHDCNCVDNEAADFSEKSLHVNQTTLRQIIIIISFINLLWTKLKCRTGIAVYVGNRF